MRALPVLCLAAVAPAAASAQALAYSGSLQYATGTYIFTEPIRSYSLQTGLSFTAGRLRLSGSIPVIIHNSGAVSVVGGSTLPTGGEDHPVVDGREGGQQVPMGQGSGPHHSVLTPVVGAALDVLGGSSAPLTAAQTATALQDSVVEEPGAYETTTGDPFVSGGLELYSGFGTVRSLEVTAAAKVPVNDLASGVGTGEWDYGLGGAAALGAGPVLAFLDVTYWWYGDLPELVLQDGLTVGGGLGVPLGGRVWVSAMATRTNRIIETAEAATTLSLGLSYAAGGTTWSLLAGTGLTETTAGLTLSLGWRVGLGG